MRKYRQAIRADKADEKQRERRFSLYLVTIC